MKKYIGTTAIAAFLAVALAIPLAAPADPVVGQLSSPVTKTKRVVPAATPATPIAGQVAEPMAKTNRVIPSATRLNTPVTRRVAEPPLVIRSFATEAPAEACVYNFPKWDEDALPVGSPFCTKKLAYQDLPPELKYAVSWAKAPEGYEIVFYTTKSGNRSEVCRVSDPTGGYQLGDCHESQIDGMSLRRIVDPGEANTETCLYDEAYFNGDTNTPNTTFCTKKLGYQDLPLERQDRISAANVADGYVLVLFGMQNGYRRPTCRLVGRNPGFDRYCNHRAIGMLLEPNVGAAKVAQEADERLRAGYALHDAVDDGAAWAANVAAERAAEERAARQAEIKAEELQNLNRDILSLVILNCSIDLLEDDESLFNTVTGVLFKGDTFCVNNINQANLPTDFDDDIEMVYIYDPNIVVTFYEEPNFQGRSITLGCGWWELIGDPENEISSVKVSVTERLGGEVCPDPDRAKWTSKDVTRWDR
jgi:hypothetical protein